MEVATSDEEAIASPLPPRPSAGNRLQPTPKVRGRLSDDAASVFPCLFVKTCEPVLCSLLNDADSSISIEAEVVADIKLPILFRVVPSYK